MTNKSNAERTAVDGSDASPCYPSDQAVHVQIVKLGADPPFICGFRGNPIGVLDEIQRDYIDNDESYGDMFTMGDGEYLFEADFIEAEIDYSVVPERVALPAYWMLHRIGFRSIEENENMTGGIAP